MKLNPADYIGKQIDAREVEWRGTGFTAIKVLPILDDAPWDEIALAYVHALRPSKIRVLRTLDGAKMDAQPWRVTVWLNYDDSIHEIYQEAEVGLPDWCPNAHALDIARIYGVDSPQAQSEIKRNSL